MTSNLFATASNICCGQVVGILSFNMSTDCCGFSTKLVLLKIRDL